MSHRRFNAYFSPDHYLLYVATPKVACTSLKWWFADLLGVDGALSLESESVESDPDLVIHDRLSRLVPQMTEANEALLNDVLDSPDYLKFCVVRNPYTRAFSGWQSKWLLREPLQSGAYDFAFDDREIHDVSDIQDAFEAFLRQIAKIEKPEHHDPHLIPQASLLEPEKIPYSIIAHIENTTPLEEALSHHLGAKYRNPFVGSCFSRNISLLPYSSGWITQESARLILQIYEKDFDQFGYERSVPLGREPLASSSMEIAARAIKLIRGRNQRIGILIRDKVPWMREGFERSNGLLIPTSTITSSDHLTRSLYPLRELDQISRYSLEIQDKLLSVHHPKNAQIKNELIRANAQLNLLKDILF